MKALEKQKTIFINGGAVLVARNKIIENGKGGAYLQAEFLVAKDDYMKKVDFPTFKEEMTKYKDVCMNSWDKQLKNDFLELIAIIEAFED